MVEDITERLMAEEALNESYLLFSAVIDGTVDPIFVKDCQGRYLMINSACEKIMGKPKSEVIGKNVTDLYSEEAARKLLKADRETLARGKTRTFEETVVLEDIERTYLVTQGVFCNLQGDKIGTFGIGKDITELKKLTNEIKASLIEKEVLLQEIHHRVKNNMQLVSSLLGLQFSLIKDKQLIEMLKDSQNRIKSLALIHERLYKSEDMANIDFNGYINSLAIDLLKSYSKNPNKIKLTIDVEDVSFGIDTAIPCGLVINELVSNSLKYGFPGGKAGKIMISLQSMNQDGYELKVSDNGVSIPEDLDFRKTESLGFQLITSIVEDQLEGSIELNRTEGTGFKINFKEIIRKNRIKT